MNRRCLWLVALLILFFSLWGCSQAQTLPADGLPTETQILTTPTLSAATNTPTAIQPTVSSIPPSATATQTPSPEPTAVSSFTPTPTLGIGSFFDVPLNNARRVYVPEGSFTMGSPDDDPKAYDDEKPQHVVFLDAFWIDQTEVTNAMFAAFLNQLGNQLEVDAAWYGAEEDFTRIQFVDSVWVVDPGFELHPAVGVNWYGARAYCSWVGGRLPTEAEWEKAARGVQGFDYPWGDDLPSSERLNIADASLASEQSDFTLNDGYPNTAPVGSFPAGTSPYGALDLAGNAWEWVADWYGSGVYAQSPEKNPAGAATGVLRGARGGSWSDHPKFSRAAYRAGFYPETYWPNSGFRCVSDNVILPEPTPTPIPDPIKPFLLEMSMEKNAKYEVGAIKELDDGGYLLVGEVHPDNSTGPMDIWLVRFSPSGKVLWQRAVGSYEVHKLDGGTAVVQTFDGGLVVAGFVFGKVIKGEHVGYPWVLKFSLDGDLLWEIVPSDYPDAAWLVGIETLDGNVRVAGNSLSQDPQAITLWTITPQGRVISEHSVRLNLSSERWLAHWMPFFDMQPTGDGGHVLAAAVAEPSTQTRLLVMRFNPDNQLIWQRDFAFNLDPSEPISIAPLGAAGFALGFTNDGGDLDGPMLGRLTVDGQPAWWLHFPFSLVAIDQVEAAQDGFVASGWGTEGAWVGFVDLNGQIQTQVSYASIPENVDQAQGLDRTYDGGFILAGSSSFAQNQVFVLRLAADLTGTACLKGGSYPSVLVPARGTLVSDSFPLMVGEQTSERTNGKNQVWEPEDVFRIRIRCP